MEHNLEQVSRCWLGLVRFRTWSCDLRSIALPCVRVRDKRQETGLFGRTLFVVSCVHSFLPGLSIVGFGVVDLQYLLAMPVHPSSVCGVSPRLL